MPRYLRRVSLPVILAAVLISLLGGAVAVAALRSPLTAPPPPPVSTPGPELGAPPSPLGEKGPDILSIDELVAQGMTRSEAQLEHLRLREEYIQQEEAAGRMQSVPVAGPETAGIAFRVAGKIIQLPPDAQLDGVIGGITCAPSFQCPDTPMYIILRDGEHLAVDRLGQVWTSEAGPLKAEEIPETFAFVREALFP